MIAQQKMKFFLKGSSIIEEVQLVVRNLVTIMIVICRTVP